MPNWNFADPQFGTMENNGAAFSIAGQGLYFAGPDQSKNFTLDSYPAADINPQDGTLPLTSEGDWRTTDLQMISSQAGTLPAPIALNWGVGAAALPQYACLFWGQKNGLMAAAVPPTSLAPPNKSLDLTQWSFLLQNTAGQAIALNSQGGDIAATALDNTRVFVATVLDTGVYIALFDYSQAQPGSSSQAGIWKASSDWSFYLSQFQGLGAAPKSLGKNISIEWFSTDGGTFWFGLSLFDRSTAYVYWLPLRRSEHSTGDAGLFAH